MSCEITAGGVRVRSQDWPSDAISANRSISEYRPGGVRLVMMFLAIMFAIFGAVPCHAQSALSPSLSVKSDSQPLSLAEMRQLVAAASRHGAPWDGPVTGPAGEAGKRIAIISEDLRNGGILGVAQGVEEAASVMQWTVRIFDAGGTPAGRSKEIANAAAWRPDGVALIGSDATELGNELARFSRLGIPVVGWHVSRHAGALAAGPVAVNVSSDPLEVARITAMAAVVSANGRAGVVIFTDSNFEIALTKSNEMIDVIRACATCQLLEVRDVAISRSATIMPGMTDDLLARYGARWTHALAINDIYFDYAVPQLTKAGLASNAVNLMSAGDGSTAAFLRIRARTFQTGTVAEPLNLHGWQLVDELNRLLAGWPVSGYVVPVHLVSAENIGFDGGPQFRYDPDNGYRDIYKKIWKR